MCGIAGFTHAEHRADPVWIRRATRSLTHRGPDQQDVFESDCVSLGAVRLKIIDLEHGRQPMSSDDGDTVLVFNGEIYNNTTLREELLSLGHKFGSRCDTEVVLRAFLQWDLDAFRRLRGMFAIALWTESQKRLVLARDRMGIKPLYICRRGDDLHFGSELKAVFEHPAIERRINHEGLHHYLSLNYVPSPHTLVDGIEKLTPGHWLEWRNGRVSSDAYWQVRFEPDARMDVNSATEELDGLLRDAVKEHLVSDVPLGVWASGGLDSSTILHYASESSTSRVKTFSVSFQGRSFDESAYFREVAGRYGTDHHEFDLAPDPDLQDVVQELVYYSDEPSADAGALPVWYLSEMTRRHVTVALSGEGADELFGGYVTYLADRYAATARRIPAGARRFAAKVARWLPVSNEKISFEYKLNRFLNGSLLPAGDAHFYWNGTFSEAEKRRLLTRDGHVSTGRIFGTANDGGGLNQFLALDQRYYLADDILYKCDRMSMAHSLEVRPPFLDHRIVEFAARLPENLKVRGSRLKFILRELMNRKLPASVLNRKKQGFDIPTHQWLRTVLNPLLRDTLTRRNVEESGLFHWREIDGLIHAHMERRANVGYHLWGLLILFLWMRRWNVQPMAAAENAQDLFTLSVSN